MRAALLTPAPPLYTIGSYLFVPNSWKNCAKSRYVSNGKSRYKMAPYLSKLISKSLRAARAHSVGVALAMTSTLAEVTTSGKSVLGGFRKAGKPCPSEPGWWGRCASCTRCLVLFKGRFPLCRLMIFLMKIGDALI